MFSLDVGTRLALIVNVKVLLLTKFLIYLFGEIKLYTIYFVTSASVRYTFLLSNQMKLETFNTCAAQKKLIRSKVCRTLFLKTRDE